MSGSDKRYLLRVWVVPDAQGGSGRRQEPGAARHDDDRVRRDDGGNLGMHASLRVSLRDVEDGQLHTFADLDDMVRFLAASGTGEEEV
jgi:hypothetical protein